MKQVPSKTKVEVCIKLIVKYEIGYYEETKPNPILARKEFALKALAFVKCLKAISFNAPAVACHHMFSPSPLVALFLGLEVLMEPLALLVTYCP